MRPIVQTSVHAAQAQHGRPLGRVQRGSRIVATCALTLALCASVAHSAHAQDEPAPDTRIPEPVQEDGYRVQGNDNTTFQVDHRSRESGAFAVEVSYAADRLPNGRYRDGRIACTLIESAGPFGTQECDSPVAAGQALDRHGPARWHVVRLDCGDGQACVSQREVQFTVHGVMGPTEIVLGSTVRALASHVERDRRRAHGFGFPMRADIEAACRDERYLAEPISRLEGSLLGSVPVCRGTLTLRSARRLALPRAAGSRLLGRSTFQLFGGPGEKLGMYFDGGRDPDAGGIRFTLAFERLLRRRGPVAVIAEMTWKDAGGHRRTQRTPMTLRAPRTRPRGCRTGCQT